MYVIYTLIALAVFVFLFLVIAVGLYLNNRTRSSRSLVAFLLIYLFYAIVQGIFAGRSELAIALAQSSQILPVFALVSILSDITGISISLRKFIIFHLFAISITLVLAYFEAPFWMLALPPCISGMAPLLYTCYMALVFKRNQLTGTGKIFTVVCIGIVIHGLDYPFLRMNDEIAVAGYAVNGFLVIASCFAATAVILEKTILDRARAQEMHQLRSRFFMNISHEFRTPLTLILGPLRDAVDGLYGPLNNELQESLHSMYRNAERLQRLINQLLDLARLEAGGLSLHAREGDLVAYTRMLTLSFASRAEREGKTIQFDALRSEIKVFFDRDKLEKIICNLLSNAFKFTSAHDKIRISVDLRDEVAQIVVRDTGNGIRPADLPHVFDRFYQVDDSPTRQHQGSGIGLSLVKELVELHHGRIDVESIKGFETIFTIKLPVGSGHLKEEEIIAETADATVLPYELPEIVQPYKNEEGVEREAPKGLILVVEDNEDVRTYIRSHLKHYKVEEAADGQEGLTKARALLPDLVISDVMMPKMDGYTLCAALKRDKCTSDIPVILLTARATEESKLEGLDVGADDYIYKPFSARELLVRTENLITLRCRLRNRYRGELVLKPVDRTVSSVDATFLEQVRDVIEEHLEDPTFGVERLAYEIALSRRQLQRRIREASDLTASGLIRMMRIERAGQLLKQKAGNVSDVAYMVGFRNPRHFSKVFQQLQGKSPREWVEANPS